MNHIESIKIDKTLGKRGKTRLMLLESAAELFEEQGYPKASMRDIAAKAGIKAGSMFYHFKDKEELLFVLMERTMLDVIESQARNLVRCNTSVSRLRTLIKTDVEAFISREPGVSFHTLIHEWRHLGQSYIDKLYIHRSKYESTWLTVLEACEKEHLITVSPRIVRRLLHGALVWIPYWYNHEGEMTIDEVIDDVLLLFIGKSRIVSGPVK